MNLFSKLFNLNSIRHWNKAAQTKNWPPKLENKVKTKIYTNAKDIGLRPEFAQEWAELGPWNT